MLHKYKKGALVYSTIKCYQGRLYKIDSIGNYFKDDLLIPTNPSVNYRIINILDIHEKLQLHHTYVKLHYET